MSRFRTRPARVSLGDARPTLESLLELILDFWDERVLDPDGGYALGHDARGRPAGDDTRHVVSQARTAWFFARLARSEYAQPHHMDWAEHGIAFLREQLWDHEHGGFHWAVGPEG